MVKLREFTLPPRYILWSAVEGEMPDPRSPMGGVGQYNFRAEAEKYQRVYADAGFRTVIRRVK